MIKAAWALRQRFWSLAVSFPCEAVDDSISSSSAHERGVTTIWMLLRARDNPGGRKVEIVESLLRVLQINVAALIFPVAGVATLLAGFSDAKWYRVPNKITYPLMALGIAYHAALPSGAGWVFALAGFSFGLLILLPFFLLGGVGAGDVKLLAGIGSCLGLHDTVAVFLVFGVLAATYAAAVFFVRGQSERVASCLLHPFRTMLATTSASHRVEDALELRERTQRWRLVPLATIMAISLFILALGRVASVMWS